MLMMSRVAAGTICTLLIFPAKQAQQSSGLGSKTPSATTPSFDVATIRPIGPETPIGFISYPGGKVSLGATSVQMLVSFAYGVEMMQVVAPSSFDWPSRQGYGITALPPESSPSRTAPQSGIRFYPTEEQALMLQNLLAERFGLKCHRELRESSVLFLEKSGKPLHLDPPQNPNMESRGGVRSFAGEGFTGEAFGQNISMARFAESVSLVLQRTVIDHTDIVGKYDFQVAGGENNQDFRDATYSALERLGLRLREGKAQVEIIVVDKISKPTEN